ncbi:hypothetical protein V8E53_001836 [Lactarius tabidus]
MYPPIEPVADLFFRNSIVKFATAESPNMYIFVFLLHHAATYSSSTFFRALPQHSSFHLPVFLANRNGEPHILQASLSRLPKAPEIIRTPKRTEKVVFWNLRNLNARNLDTAYHSDLTHVRSLDP